MARPVDPQVSPFDIHLFSMPWMKGDWPCLGIATVKSYVQAAGLTVRCSHFHLDAAARLGWSAYNAVAESWGAGEALFGALLDPNDAARLTGLAARELREKGFDDVADWVLGDALEQLSTLVDHWIDETRAIDAHIVGGSIGALQLCGTLFIMRRLKERGHQGTRVLGGSGLVGSVAMNVLGRAPYVDYAVDGEGEQAFLSLALAIRDEGSVPAIAGVCRRDEASSAVQPVQRAQPIDLSQSPAPDLSEFFATAARLGVPKTALTLSLEHSRGCEWEHRTPGQLRGCTFCGLYRNSPDFRRKPVARVVNQVRDSVARYRNLNIAFVDAYLPEADRDKLIDELNGIPEDITYFSELRCDLTAQTVAKLSLRARRVQLGVESFSTALLRRIGKGLSAARSAYCVRLCQEAGIKTQYNLMLNIPGATSAEIAGLRADLPILFGLLPPVVTHFYLDRNSIAFQDPVHHGIDVSSLDEHSHPWLPTSLGDSRVSQVVPFRPASDNLDSDWKAVATVVEEWLGRSRAAQSAGLPSPLVWHLGSGWASIIDMRESREKVFEIEGLHLDVFLACDNVMSLANLSKQLPDQDRAQIDRALEDLVAMRLIFKDDTRYVRVAVRHAQLRMGH
jgi:ribosomal peptide maturation radical SAM protein 1